MIHRRKLEAKFRKSRDRKDRRILSFPRRLYVIENKANDTVG
jgi:hypothetical protein